MTTSITNNFHGNITQNGNGTLTGNVTNITQEQTTVTANDIAELRVFLQAWRNHQQSKIIENPENNGIALAKALESQKPDLWAKIKYRLTNGGIGAGASLLSDLATGEEPMKAVIKASFAFIGGAATRP
jgi:hypothetical protein